MLLKRLDHPPVVSPRSRSLVIGLLGVMVLWAVPLLAQDGTKPVDLLQGKLSDHWITEGNWKLDKDHVVTLEPRAGESGWRRYKDYLWSKKEYKDFEIEFDYKVNKSGNSGFYFHVSDLNSPVVHGIEVQIYDSHPKGTKKKLSDHDSGGVIPGFAPVKNAAKPAAEWNTFHIVCQGNALTVKLNGVVVNNIQLDNPKLSSRKPTGRIGFQDHGMPLRLRNIRIKPL